MIDLKKIGITATALGAFALAAGTAEAQNYGGSYGFTFNKLYDEDVYVDWYNSISVSIEKSWTISLDLSYTGTIYMHGYVYGIEASAIALIDNKQISDFNWVETWNIYNDAYVTDVYVSGNAQANAAAGNGNQQENIAAIAEVGDIRGYSGGYASAEAEVFALQKHWQNYVYDHDGYNDAYVSYIQVDGNFQGNAAAGNLNQQKNALAIAVADSAVLSLASAAALQEVHYSDVWVDYTPNYASVYAVWGSGNFQANAAAGNLNQQLNSLSIAAPGS